MAVLTKGHGCIHECAEMRGAFTVSIPKDVDFACPVMPLSEELHTPLADTGAFYTFFYLGSQYKHPQFAKRFFPLR